MKQKKKSTSQPVHIDSVIQLVRGERVILDTDLAKIYGIPTFRLNEAVKRNRDRFPNDFLFQLTKDEHETLTSQNAMSKKGRGGQALGRLTELIHWLNGFWRDTLGQNRVGDHSNEEGILQHSRTDRQRAAQT